MLALVSVHRAGKEDVPARLSTRKGAAASADAPVEREPRAGTQPDGFYLQMTAAPRRRPTRRVQRAGLVSYGSARQVPHCALCTTGSSGSCTSEEPFGRLASTIIHSAIGIRFCFPLVADSQCDCSCVTRD